MSFLRAQCEHNLKEWSDFSSRPLNVDSFCGLFGQEVRRLSCDVTGCSREVLFRNCPRDLYVAVSPQIHGDSWDLEVGEVVGDPDYVDIRLRYEGRRPTTRKPNAKSVSRLQKIWRCVLFKRK